MARSAFRPFPWRSLGAPGQGTARGAGSLQTSQHSPAQQLEAGATVTRGNHALTIRPPPPPPPRYQEKFLPYLLPREFLPHRPHPPPLQLWPPRTTTLARKICAHWLPTGAVTTPWWWKGWDSRRAADSRCR